MIPVSTTSTLLYETGQVKVCKDESRHDRKSRFSKSVSRIEIYHSHLTPIISRLLIIKTMLQNPLKKGQAVLEWKRLVPDPLAVSTFNHAGQKGCL